MTRIAWGSFGSRKFEAGVDRTVFYPQQGPGVPWNGVVAIKEEPTGASLPVQHIDGVPFRSQKTKEGFALILQALTCPKEFDEYENLSEGLLTKQRKRTFGLSYRTLIGNDELGLAFGNKIHLVYNALAMPSKVDFSSLSKDGLDATPFSWGISTSPVDIPTVKPAAHLIVDTSIAYPEAIQALEDILYGSENTEPRLPDPVELMALFEEYAIFVVIDHGDGTWTASGPDEMVHMLDATTFEIVSPTVEYLDEDTYSVRSM